MESTSLDGTVSINKPPGFNNSAQVCENFTCSDNGISSKAANAIIVSNSHYPIGKIARKITRNQLQLSRSIGLTRSGSIPTPFNIGRLKFQITHHFCRQYPKS